MRRCNNNIDNCTNLRTSQKQKGIIKTLIVLNCYLDRTSIFLKQR